MPVLTYKCPNCSGPLEFDPARQRFHCGYCLSDFTEEDLEKLDPISAREQTIPQEEARPEETAPEQKARAAEPDLSHTVVYSCPSCGAEIVTDETTAATYCYYCHNPVVLSGRLEGRFEPQRVIPFALKKEQAVESFLQWVHKKKFVPHAFFSKDQIEKITGVYFPFWMVDCDLEADLAARATQVRSWRSGNYRYTETRHFYVERGGSIHFEDVLKNALTKANRKLVESVQPFQEQGLREFTPGYLLGFQAEKRDIEREGLQHQLDQEVHSYAQTLLRESISGYASVIPETLRVEQVGERWDYVLLPVWVLTYRPKQGKKLYYYAMNGQTGKVSGILPVSWRRLAVLFSSVAAALFAILCVGGYFL